jgi:hypothetical protein
MYRTILLAVLMFASASPITRSAEPPAKSDIPTPKFERQVIDAKIQIGYGLAIGDVDGDGKPDILLADKKQIVWYRNPDWKRFVIAEDLTPQDNVCIAARDIDGSGKVSVAVGAGWNPSETSDPTKSGGVFYLIRPKDPTQHWEPVRLHHEVTTHRMQWVKTGRARGDFQLVVVPLHGLGNKDGKGDGARILAYDVPENPHDQWKTHLLDDTMHMTHNFDVVARGGLFRAWDLVYVAGHEGVRGLNSVNVPSPYPPNAPRGFPNVEVITNDDAKSGVGEARFLHLPLPSLGGFATIEPMHGDKVVLYSIPAERTNLSRRVIDDSLAEGHALACSDLLGLKYCDQIVAGWRAPNKDKKVGIKLYVPLDDKGEKWQTHLIDDNQMACEDLKIADLDGDGQPDIIASGRATHNLVIYWNRTKAK